MLRPCSYAREGFAPGKSASAQVLRLSVIGGFHNYSWLPKGCCDHRSEVVQSSELPPVGRNHTHLGRNHTYPNEHAST